MSKKPQMNTIYHLLYQMHKIKEMGIESHPRSN